MEQDQVIQCTSYLVGYFDQQDRAKRLTTPGFMSREIASYYQTQRRKMAQEVVTSAVKVGTLQEIRKRIKRLVRKAEKAQGDELRKIGAEIEELYRQAEQWRN